MARFAHDARDARDTTRSFSARDDSPDARALRWLAWGSVAALVLVLLPLVLISLYNHSYADDWHYGVWAHLMLEDTGGNVLAAIAEAIRQVGVTWVDWQGTYTAILLMGLEPGVFGEGAYVVAAWIILGTLVASTFYFARVLIVDYLHADRVTWVCVSCVVLILQLLFQPSPVEGIFWYNSAIYYTFFHSLSLVFFGQLLRTLNPTLPPRADLRRRTVVSTVLAVLLAGGNFVSLLVALELLGGVLVWMSVRHDERRGLVIPPFVGLAAGAVVSFVAPGNAERQATQFPEDKLGVFQTIWGSSVASFRFLSSWTTGMVLLGMLFLLPLVLRAVRSPRVPRQIRFLNPSAVTVASLALFASSFTPTFYSMGYEGPGRVQNCRYDMFIVLLVVNMVFWAGWAVRQYGIMRREDGDDRATIPSTASPVAPADAAAYASHAPEGVPVIATGRSFSAGGPEASARASVRAERMERRHARERTTDRTFGMLVACSLVALVFAVSLISMDVDETAREEVTSLSAAHSLVTGQAAAYDAQVKARLEYLGSSKDASVRVPFYTDVPKVLLMGDIRDNMNTYINYRLSQWFRKDSIVGYSGSQMEAVTTDANPIATTGAASSGAATDATSDGTAPDAVTETGSADGGAGASADAAQSQS